MLEQNGGCNRSTADKLQIIYRNTVDKRFYTNVAVVNHTQARVAFRRAALSVEECLMFSFKIICLRILGIFCLLSACDQKHIFEIDFKISINLNDMSNHLM